MKLSSLDRLADRIVESATTSSARDKLDVAYSFIGAAIYTGNVLTQAGQLLLWPSMPEGRRRQKRTELVVASVRLLQAVTAVRRRRWNAPLMAWTDAAVVSYSVLASGFRLPRGEFHTRNTALAWLAFGAGTLSEGLPPGQRELAVGVMSGAAAAGSVVNDPGGGAPRLARALRLPVETFGWLWLARTARDHLAASVGRLDELRATAARQSAETTETNTRTRAQRLVHDYSLQTMERIAADPDLDLESARRLLSAELERLERAVGAVAGGSSVSVPACVEAAVADAPAPGVAVVLTIAPDCSGIELSPASADALRGCVREALRNVHKHAGPCRVEVRARRVDGGVAVTVTDDGAGFDPAAAVWGHGVNRITRTAVEAENGRLQIRSAPGHGTSVEATLPLH